MKSILLHTRQVKSEIDTLSKKGNGVPEPVKEKTFKSGDSITALITIETGDDITEIKESIFKEIEKFSNDVGEKEVVLAPFAHLSNKLAPYSEGIQFFNLLEEKLKSNGFNVLRIHFGSDKSLLLDIYGHPGNVRFREF